MKESYKLATDIITVNRNRLFYNQYRYCLRLGIDDASSLRGLPDLDKIDDNFDFYYTWRKSYETKERTRRRDNLHGFYKHLITAVDPFKFVVSNWVVWIYSSDLNFLNSIINLPGVTIPEFSEAVITHPIGTVLLKKSDYCRRTFLRRTQVSADKKQVLKNFFNNHHGSIKLSGSFKIWLDDCTTHTYDYYFIDHNDDSLIVLMSLLHPGLARTTVDLLVDK